MNNLELNFKDLNWNEIYYYFVKFVPFLIVFVQYKINLIKAILYYFPF